MNKKSSPIFLTWFRNIHLILGALVCIPTLMWCISGFFLALPPGTIKGEPYRPVEMSKVKLSPAAAIESLNAELGEAFEPTSVALEQRGEQPRFSVFAKGKSYYIDAGSGRVTAAPPPSRLKRWIRNAHFFNFAGSYRTRLLQIFSALAALSTCSGLLLLLMWVWRRFKAH